MEIHVGMVIEGGRDFTIRRTVEKRLSRHLWRVRCEDGRGSYYFDFTTKELREMAEKFCVKEA